MDGNPERLGYVHVPRMNVPPGLLSRRALLRMIVAGILVTSVSNVPVAGERDNESKIAESYKPKVEGDINDLKVDARKLLLNIPRVTDAKYYPAKEKPKRRIVQLLDWHWIPKELFMGEQEFIEARLATDDGYVRKRENAIVGKMEEGGVLILGGGHNLSDNVTDDCEYLRVETKAYGKCGATAEGARTQQEIDARYEECLREVEAVQADQKIVLGCLARHHGLKRVYQGEMQATLRSYQDLVEAVREYPDEPLFRETRLQIGAAGQLLASGVLREVRPADDFFLLLEGMERRKE